MSNPKIDNAERIKAAGRAILAFDKELKTDPDSVLCDLLTDLMHWAHVSPYDFDEELRRARVHYYRERAEEFEWMAAGARSLQKTNGPPMKHESEG